MWKTLTILSLMSKQTFSLLIFPLLIMQLSSNYTTGECAYLSWFTTLTSLTPCAQSPTYSQMFLN